MNVFMAAVYTNRYMRGQRLYEDLNEREREIVHGLPHILESYHYVHKQTFVDEMRADNAKVFLDSGAFSAHTLGVELKVADYCDYIKKNIDIIRIEDGDLMASVLDGIGDPLKTWRNQQEMEWRGVRPLPCFHFGEDERYLEWYIQNYSYITIGGMVGKTVPTLTTWLDRIWSKYLLDKSGNPRIKVHAFGITSVSIMERYPWYSCDSSSWVQMTAFGAIMSPTLGPLKVSEKSPSRHDMWQHVSNFSEIEKLQIHKMIEDNGFSFERLSTIYQSRAAWNLYAFGEINKKINSTPNKTIPTMELF